MKKRTLVLRTPLHFTLSWPLILLRLGCGILLASFPGGTLSGHAQYIPPQDSNTQFSGSRGERTSLPVITSIRRDNLEVVVTASIPPNLRKITLESRNHPSQGSWTPRIVSRLDGSGGETEFHLPISTSQTMELLRIRADEEDSLPLFFYQGTNTFSGEPTSPNGTPGSIYRSFEDSPTANTDAQMDDSRDVVESDIFQIQNDTLYFFNQYRGLQVIDVSNPDQAAIQGTLELPAAGEQMYLLGPDHLILLVQSGCYFSQENESDVLLVTQGSPEVTARLPVPGRIVESRLVGSALYVASQTYRQVDNTDGSTWEWGLVLSSFDLSNPNAPLARDSLWFSGYGNVVSATDRFFFVVTTENSNWRQSIVNTVDISDPAGHMQRLHSLRPLGRIPDKFKIHVHNQVLTLISQVQTTNLFTRLETFSLAEPASPVKLGELDLGLSERLHATRFAGDLVYVVTFFVQFRIDPLWVVDLSDPTRPEVKGFLEIPGFSTFLRPRGDQLIALGVETNRTTVSLFDVADPTNPQLLHRVQVGDGWAWSEANWNEKAFNVVEEENLILLPFQSWTTNGYLRQVQLIDLHPDSLTLRGVIDHEFSPRRAAVHQDRILSLSGWEMFSVDFSDRDDPEIVHELPLSWPVNRLVLAGDYLIEVESGNFWFSEQRSPTVRVAHIQEPDRVLTELTLDALPVSGLSRRGDQLYIAQSASSYYPIWYLDDAGQGEEEPTAPPNFILTTLNLANLPSLEQTGQTRETLRTSTGGNWNPIWPRDNLLVWSGGGFNYGWGPIAVGLVADFRFWPPWGYGGGGQLLAFDVETPSEPRLVSDLNLSTNQWWNFSQPQTGNGLVYLSHQATVFDEYLQIDGLTVTNDSKAGTWVTRYFLNVIDYQDPEHPTLRPTINIPGQLKGLTRDGSILHTVGYHFDEVKGTTDWKEHLVASAYDGTQAYLIDSLPLPDTWPHPVLLSDDSIFIGVSGHDYVTQETKPHYLETWTLPDTGLYTRLSQTELTESASHFKAFGHLLAVRQSDNTLVLFDTTLPDALRQIGRNRPPGCLWFDLDKADGALTRGVWIPLGLYGTAKVLVEDF